MMRGEAAIAALRDKGGPPGWMQHLDRSLVARLERRPTVIPPALGDRIRRRVEYFTGRTQSLAQALIDRVSPAVREVADMPVVHVGWRQASLLFAPDAPAASSGGEMAAASAPRVVRVESVEVETVRHVRIEADASAAYTPARPALPVVAVVQGPPGMQVATPASDTVATPVAAAGRRGHGGSTPVAAPQTPVVPHAHGPQPPSASRDDEMITLKMPPARARTMPRPGPDHPAPAVDALSPPPPHASGGARLAPEPRDEAVRTLDMPPLRPASAAAGPMGGEVGGETAGPAPAAAHRGRAGAGSPASPGQERPAVAMPARSGDADEDGGRPPPVVPAEPWRQIVATVDADPLPLRPALAAAVRMGGKAGSDAAGTVAEAGYRGRAGAAPSVSQGRERPVVAVPVRPGDADEDGGRPAPAVPTEPRPQVVPVGRSRPEGVAGEQRAVEPGLSPGETRTPVRVSAVRSGTFRQPVVAPGPHASLANDPRHEALPFDTRSAAQPVLPHAGHPRPVAAEPASPLAASSEARGHEPHASESAGARAPNPLHVPVLSASAGTPPEGPHPSRPLPAPIDVAQLARRVERRIMKHLAIDAERRGGRS